MPKRSALKRTSPVEPDHASSADEFVIRPGQLFWIPKRKKARGDLGLGATAYYHPCVVLSNVTQDGKVTILIVSDSGSHKKLTKYRILTQLSR
jgi:hypothetical protein